MEEDEQKFQMQIAEISARAINGKSAEEMYIQENDVSVNKADTSAKT